MRIARRALALGGSSLAVACLVLTGAPGVRADGSGLAAEEQAAWERLLASVGLTDEAASQTTAGLPIVASPDEPAFFDPFSGPIAAGDAGDFPPGYSIRALWGQVIRLTDEQVARLRAAGLACDAEGIVCQEERYRLTTPNPVEWFVATWFLDRPIETTGPDLADTSLVVHDARLGPVAPARPGLPGGDPLGGGNRYVGITDPPGAAPPFVTTSYWDAATGQWTRTRSHAFAIADGTLVQLWWPVATELFTLDGVRPYAGVAKGGRFGPRSTTFMALPPLPDGWAIVDGGIAGLPLVQTDGTYAPGREPKPAPRPSATATATPSPPATPTAIPAPTPTPTPGPTPTPASGASPTATPSPPASGPVDGGPTTGSPPIVALVGLGVGALLAVLGILLLVRSRGSAAAGATTAPALLGSSRGPCDDLAEALAGAERACAEARAAAAKARAAADAQTAEATAARTRADEATRAREEAERELARELEPPDEGTDNVSSGGLTLTKRDLRLLEEARAELAATYDPQLRGATSSAQRESITGEYRQALEDVESPDGLEALRRRADAARDERISSARARLAAAGEREQQANREAADAEQAAQRARGSAVARDAEADVICRRAEAAREAYDACVGRERRAAAGDDEERTGAGGAGGDAGAGDQPGRVPGGEPGGAGGGVEVGGEMPPPGGTTPRPPKPRVCPEGAEEWRAIETRSFRLLARDARIGWAVHPVPVRFGEWIAPRQVDDAGNEVEGPPSVSQRSMRMMRGDLDLLFGSLDHQRASMGTRYDQEVVITVPFVTREVRKERRHVCRDGAWVETNECRVVELSLTATPFAYGRGRERVTLTVVRGIYNDAMAGIEAAAEQERQMAHFERACP